MNKINVTINNVEVLPTSVLPFYQKDPFPGGHSLELKISFDDEISLNNFVK